MFNRRFLEAKLRELFDRRVVDGTLFSLLFIDLDGFKPLNDRFGHPFGDLVLQKIADCLSGQVRQGDFVARFGGDEFCVLCEGIGRDRVTETLSQRIWQSINEQVTTQGANEGKVGASIGAVVFGPETEWLRPEQMLAAADRAMYVAKSHGKNRVVFWSSLSVAIKTASSNEVVLGQVPVGAGVV